MVTQESERFSRQQDLVPMDLLAGCKATVVGVGAIGRQVALQLAAMGIQSLQLVDFDIVEENNLASQGYLEEDLERMKVEVTADLCRRINNNLEVQAVVDRFKRSMEVGSAVFICVDRIDTRRLIWEAVGKKAHFFADGRMAGEVLRILVACDAASRKHYSTTLFAAEEAYAGSCTAKTTIYCANIAAGLLLAQFSKWLRRLPVEPDLSLNLLAREIILPANQ